MGIIIIITIIHWADNLEIPSSMGFAKLFLWKQNFFSLYHLNYSLWMFKWHKLLYIINDHLTTFKK